MSAGGGDAVDFFEGRDAVSIRNEIIWEVLLEPEETRTLEYRYRVFAP